jgi:hypothetical protein
MFSYFGPRAWPVFPLHFKVSISVDEVSCGTCSKYNSKRLSLDFFSANLAYKVQTNPRMHVFFSVFVSGVGFCSLQV